MKKEELRHPLYLRLGLGVCLLVLFATFGCGSTPEVVVVPASTPMPTTPTIPSAPTNVPPPTPSTTTPTLPSPLTATPSPPATASPTATPTPSPTIAASTTSCQPNADYVADVTIPDGALLAPGKVFAKTWRLQSNGCAPWPAGSTWVFVSGDRMGAPSGVSVPDTSLGSTADVTVEMVAPTAEGTYQGYWQMQTPTGERFGDRLWVQIAVSPPTPTLPLPTPPTPTPTSTPVGPPPPTDIAFLSIDSFVGTWFNVDPNTGSWTKIEITKQGNALFAHFWGACTPTDCDAGETSAAYQGSPVNMFIDSGFATRNHTLSLDGDLLHVTTFTHFTDNSGRPDYTSDDYFSR